MKKRVAGFTLIELMLVVIIISILVATVAPRLVGRSEQAKIASAVAGVKGSLATAFELYEVDNGRFPSTAQGIESLRQKPVQDPMPENWRGPYVKEKPIDPWGNPYNYTYPGVHNNDYDLTSNGPDGVMGNEDDIVNWQDNT